MKRRFILFMVALLILFMGVVTVIYSSIGSVIVATIEKHGSRVMQTTVTLKSAEFAPTNGSGMLNGLTISNPPGFKTEYAFFFDRISFSVKIDTITEGVIVIKEMHMIAPEVIYEIGVNKDNLNSLRSNIDQAPPPSNSDAPVKKMIIENLYIEKGTVWISGQNLDGNRQTAVMRDIHLKDIGKIENGLLPKQLLQTIAGPFMREVTLAALGTDLSLEDQTHNILKGLRRESETALKALTKQGNVALEAMSHETREALETLDSETGRAVETVKRETSDWLDWLNDFLGSSEQKQ